MVREPPHKVFQRLQSQYLTMKLNKLKATERKQSLLNQEEMFPACHLSYEGMKEKQEIVNKKIKKLGKNITLEEYKEIIAPLGNFIIGYKIIDNFCDDYLDDKIIKDAKIYYEQMKAKIMTIDGVIDDREHSIDLQRDYGVLPRTSKAQPITIYNVDDKTPIRNVEQYTLRDAIEVFEKKWKKKHAFWRGAKTQAFETFLRRYYKRG